MILGLIGAKGSGKTTLAQDLVHYYKFKWYPFAEPIRQMLRVLLTYQGCEESEALELLWGDRKEERTPFFGGQTVRWAMQSLGTEWGRELIDENIWVNAWKNAINRRNNSNIVVDDVRFVSEEIAIRELGGKIILILRDKHNPGIHRSERNYLSIIPDITIYNNDDPIKMLRTLEGIDIVKDQLIGK